LIKIYIVFDFLKKQSIISAILFLKGVNKMLQVLKKNFKFIFIQLLISCVLMIVAQSLFAKTLTDNEKISYVLGVNMGLNLQRVDFEPNLEYFTAGLKDSIAQKGLILNDTEIANIMINFQNEIRNKQIQKMLELSEKNKKAGEKFLEENKTKPGVITLENGIQYKVLVSANNNSGVKPKATDKVKVNYIGRLLDGKEFDNSYKRGEALEIALDSVISGWAEVVTKMQVGDKWEVYIPAQFGYGEMGAGSVIGPNETLIFEIELLEILKDTNSTNNNTMQEEQPSNNK